MSEHKTDNEEENQLIAEFIGWIRREANAEYNLPQWYKPDTKDGRKKGRFMGYPEQLKFHTSWDWLMPVCQKLKMDEVSTDINKTYKDVLDRIMEANKGL